MTNLFRHLSQTGTWLPTLALVALIFTAPPFSGFLALVGNARCNKRVGGRGSYGWTVRA